MVMLMQETIDEAHTKTVGSCSWSPSGHLLAVASFDGTVSIWDKIDILSDCTVTLLGNIIDLCISTGSQK